MHPKILADENIDFRIIRKLRGNGFEVVSVREDFKGMPDRKVIEEAVRNRALVLTEDSDFGEWVFVHKEKSTGVIFLRYKPDEIENVSGSLIKTLTGFGKSLYGKFVVITPSKIRIREIP